MENFLEALVPIVIVSGVCVVLPVLIVWLIARAATNSETQRSRVLIEAIKSGSVDTSNLVKALEKKKRTSHEILNLRLLRGCIFTLLGVAALIIAIIYLNTDPGIQMHDFFFLLSGICIPIGASYLIVYFVSRKSLPQEKEECIPADFTVADNDEKTEE